MIAGIGWHNAGGHGWLRPNGGGESGESTGVSAPALSELAGGAIKYFPRLTAPARVAMHAAGLALRAAGWEHAARREVGILCGGYGNWISSSRSYFSDYADHGRAIGRANLFIYTLPTSIASEIAIAMGLGGPTLHLQQSNVMQGLLDEAHCMLCAGEVPGMLALWADFNAAVCVAVGAGEGQMPFDSVRPCTHPSELAAEIAARFERRVS